jgi:hypothetical protein
MTVEEHEFTVKEILESCAYARGGVHLHSPSARDTALFLTDAVGFFGTPMTIAMINQIVNVILKGLQPLTDALTVEFEQKKAAGGS